MIEGRKSIMRVSIHDRDALRAVSPASLSAFTQSTSRKRLRLYRRHSTLHCVDTLPEIIVPETDRLRDYTSAVASLIKTFAEMSDQDELTVHLSPVTADREVICIRAGEGDDGSLRVCSIS